MTDDVDERVLLAEQAMNAGDRAATIKAWQAVIELAPDHPVALNILGNWRLAQGDAKAAVEYLLRAVAADPCQPALLFNLAAAQKSFGDISASLDSLNSALAADPYFVQAIFQMGLLYEESGDIKSAASVYRNFVDTAPPEIISNPLYAAAIDHARSVIAKDDNTLEGKFAPIIDGASPRIKECISALLGRDRIYVSEPTFLTVPRLPAIPFLDREMTPWIDALEQQASVIIDDARHALAAGTNFIPYVANPPGTPLNQWKQLNHSDDWGAFFFWKHGVRNVANCARLRATPAALEGLPLLELDGRGPNAFFSRLLPRTRIPPHTGVTNARLTVHLPLIVPKGCGFRVGGETREWVPGKAWVFDDTIEHEAWNDSDEPRTILIFDVWHPMLDAEERAGLTEIFANYDTHYGVRTGLSDAL